MLQLAQTHFSKGAHLFENLDLYILQVEHILHMFRLILMGILFGVFLAFLELLGDYSLKKLLLTVPDS